jgi:hypothetical protein
MSLHHHHHRRRRHHYVIVLFYASCFSLIFECVCSSFFSCAIFLLNSASLKIGLGWWG